MTYRQSRSNTICFSDSLQSPLDSKEEIEKTLERTLIEVINKGVGTDETISDVDGKESIQSLLELTKATENNVKKEPEVGINQVAGTNEITPNQIEGKGKEFFRFIDNCLAKF